MIRRGKSHLAALSITQGQQALPGNLDVGPLFQVDHFKFR
jgi:hypothetical protein